MTTEFHSRGHEGAASGQPGRKMISRRTLLRGGTPILMTVASQRVLAAACATPSAFTSANASRPNDTVLCSGLAPEGWISASSNQSKYSSNQWPVQPNSKFNSIFTPVAAYDKFTLLDVLNFPNGTQGSNPLARYIVAAWLNAKTGKVPANILGVAQVTGMWQDFVTSNFGTFNPTAGVIWHTDDAIVYLKTTMS
ncbi:MAG TPA: hypothetical protein VFP68_23755 [Burkholderiaceae bacterium]|nr:hypothetical protein [Burkholderiaceae bacterium]